MSDNGGMRIVALTAENIKRLRAVRIAPHGASVVPVSGRNSQGKTSVLDSIEMALGGGRMPDMPVRLGEKHARIVVDLGDLIVERKFDEAGDSTLAVREKRESGASVKFDKPQALLDRLVGDLAFDPLQFSRMKPAEQRDTLIRALGLSEQFAVIDGKIHDARERRRLLSADRRARAAQLDAMPNPNDPPAARVVVDELMVRLREQQALARKRLEIEQSIKEIKQKTECLVKKQSDAHDSIASARQQIKALEELIAKKEAFVSECEAAIGAESGFLRAALKTLEQTPVPDEQSVLNEISGAEKTNRLFDQVEQRAAVSAALTKIDGLLAECEGEIERLGAEKLEMLSRSKIPVAGLSVDAEGVLLNGIPFAQASAAERLTVGVAVGAMSRTKVRVMIVRDGSLLDDESWALLEKLAAEHNLQVWVEVVDSSGECGVMIEDGEVVSDRFSGEFGDDTRVGFKGGQ